MTFVGCSACGAEPIEECVCAARRALYERAHEALDRWLDDCQTTAQETQAIGRSGYIGRFELRANADDEGVTLQIERTIVEDV